jgi:manganese/zinc/iron transport system substrate-binding protein
MIQFCAVATKARQAQEAFGPLKLLPLLLIVVILSSLSTACADSAQSKRFKVVATTSIIADTAREIAGEDAQVEALMGAGIDPHLYKASPGDLRKLSDASLILYNGLHLEGRLAEVLERLGQRKPTLAITSSIPAEALRPLTSQGTMYDPHVWFDVSLWIEAARAMHEALAQYDPAHAAGYSRRFEQLAEKLRSLHAWCTSELASIPKPRRVLITAHDAFGYFGRAYDIEVLGIQGVSTDSEASVREINTLVQLIVDRKIPAVFVESTISPKAVEALVEGAAARGHAVQIGGQLLSDALGDAGTPQGTYIGMVRHNISTILAALRGPGTVGTQPRTL